MYVSPEFIKLLSERISILDVVSGYLPLTRKGTRYVACCPFHNEKTPSFTINLQTNTFICFGCKESGDIYTFIQKIKNVDFIVALEMLAQQAGLEIPKSTSQDQEKLMLHQEYLKIMQAAQQFFRTQFDGEQGKVARDYTVKRGLRPDIVHKFALGFTGRRQNQLRNHLLEQGFDLEKLIDLSLTSKNGKYDFYINRLMFPIFNKQKKVIAFGGRTLGDDINKYINSGETPIYIKGNHLYGIAQAFESKNRQNSIIIVEGYLDTIMMHQHGFDKTVACLGTALTPNQVKTIWGMSAIPIVCFDGDPAGIQATRRSAYAILPALRAGCSLQFAWLPDNLDPDNYLQQQGRTNLSKIFKQTTSLSQHVWNSLKAEYYGPLPEQRALWHAQVKAKLSTIEHNIIRAEYYDVFKEWGYRSDDHEVEYNKSLKVFAENKASYEKINVTKKFISNATIKSKKFPKRPTVNINDTKLTREYILITLPFFFPGILHDICEGFRYY